MHSPRDSDEDILLLEDDGAAEEGSWQAGLLGTGATGVSEASFRPAACPHPSLSSVSIPQPHWVASPESQSGRGQVSPRNEEAGSSVSPELSEDIGPLRLESGLAPHPPI